MRLSDTQLIDDSRRSSALGHKVLAKGLISKIRQPRPSRYLQLPAPWGSSIDAKPKGRFSTGGWVAFCSAGPKLVLPPGNLHIPPVCILPCKVARPEDCMEAGRA
ncbi:uncharacterized protein TrAFT101_009194 [Trichoderma asperellum]|uniref:uncharacterized protein n=1 Tax=Trichoderma asperellum TaxID=101201 RepID=UPI003324E94A|nr:hypothetical protein TrAFT101_009194 [Trichoderma asperellum]